jgi:hypothetical protein
VLRKQLNYVLAGADDRIGLLHKWEYNILTVISCFTQQEK